MSQNTRPSRTQSLETDMLDDASETSTSFGAWTCARTSDAQVVSVASLLANASLACFVVGLGWTISNSPVKSHQTSDPLSTV